MLYKLKVIGTVLIGTTILYIIQTGLKRFDLVNRTLKFLWPSRSRSAIKNETEKQEEEDKAASSTYPLQKVFLNKNLI